MLSTIFSIKFRVLFTQWRMCVDELARVSHYLIPASANTKKFHPIECVKYQKSFYH